MKQADMEFLFLQNYIADSNFPYSQVHGPCKGAKYSSLYPLLHILKYIARLLVLICHRQMSDQEEQSSLISSLA